MQEECYVLHSPGTLGFRMFWKLVSSETEVYFALPGDVPSDRSGRSVVLRVAQKGLGFDLPFGGRDLLLHQELFTVLSFSYLVRSLWVVPEMQGGAT